MDGTKVITVRLPEGDFDRAKEIAERRNISLNKLMQEGLKILERQDRERRLFDDFTLLGEAGNKETSLEFGFEAQKEVIDRDLE